MDQQAPDKALVLAAQGGDRQAFARLVEGEYDLIFRIAVQWCGNPTDAADIAQQACIKLARSLEQFRFESAFRTWLYRLVINCARDWQRAEARHDAEGGDEGLALVDAQPALVASAEVSDYLDAVLAWVATLGEGFQEALLLVLGEGMSHREAAEVLGVAESTVSWRIHEIRKQLKPWHQQQMKGRPPPGDHRETVRGGDP